MQTIYCFALALTVSVSAIAAEESDDSKKPADQQLLQGEWTPVKAELAGTPLPDNVLKQISLKLLKNEYKVLVAGKSDDGTWTIEPDSKPKRMKIVGVKGPNAKKTFLAIYELTGDTLRICYDLSGKEYPTEFKTKRDTKLYLVTYERKKSESTSKFSNSDTSN